MRALCSVYTLCVGLWYIVLRATSLAYIVSRDKGVGTAVAAAAAYGDAAANCSSDRCM